ncbi:MAG: DMT family transporter [Rhizobiaceae bacterium]|nr:DMT family transporter [Rhizobiaceae bacterium]
MQAETTLTERPDAQHALGVVLVVCSAAAFGLAGILTKSVNADAIVIACWRGLFGFVFVLGYVTWRARRDGTGLGAFRLGWQGCLMAAVGAVSSLAFIGAFRNTYVANVTIIYATAPFVAAGLAYLILRERTRAQTLVAALTSLGGVGIMVSAGIGTGNLFGDMLALVMTLLSALYIVLIRQFRDTPVVWAGAVSAAIVFFFGWLVADPLAITFNDGLLLFAFGLAFAVAVILWTEGARLVPAAEAGLLGAAEVPFAVFFAIIFLSELPPLSSVIGGAIVLGSVVAHAGLDWRNARTRST